MVPSGRRISEDWRVIISDDVCRVGDRDEPPCGEL